MSEVKRAAVSYIEGLDGRILCVWNAKYGTWGLPGGKVETGESVAQAQERELREETGLSTCERSLMFEDEHRISEGGSGRHVSVFRVMPVYANGAPKEMERGCPVTWLTHDQLLKWSAFAPFYDRMFNAISTKPVALAPRADRNMTAYVHADGLHRGACGVASVCIAAGDSAQVIGVNVLNAVYAATSRHQ